ncbi:medium chain dehydrogenase/reductase family protein [bacterium]|nr:medium chain dehydrogenase/reductase family protein [bacterium]
MPLTHRIVVRRPGAYDRLELVEEPIAEPGEGEVRIRVEAIGVNFADTAVRMGLYRAARKLVGWPITPGFEVAGRVDEIGPGVNDLALDERVMALTLFGGYAAHVVVPRDAVFRVPPDWSINDAAGFAVVFLTAYYALFELGGPRAGGAVLVHSAAGGVGQALMQLCRIGGFRAIGVVGSAHKIDAVRALGAEAVIDRSAENLWRRAAQIVPEGYDVVCDAIGYKTLRGGYAALRPGGQLVSFGLASMMKPGRGKPDWPRIIWGLLRMPRYNPMKLTIDNKSVHGFNLSCMYERRELLAAFMERLLEWAAQGRIAPAPTRTFPLAEAGEAHRSLESGETTGKLVLVPGG